jgi:hypothetical protein
MEALPMRSTEQLFAFLGPNPFPANEVTRARRLYLAAQAFAASLALIAFWGLAAGTTTGRIAFVNAISVPVLLVVSSAAALPAGLLVFRLTVRDADAVDLVLGHAAAAFGASLVLALLAPIVLLYQYSSSWAGPLVAFGSAILGLAAGFAFLVRGLAKLAPEPWARKAMLVPVGLVCVLQIASLLQLAAIAPPVMPERTLAGRGIDALPHAER